MSTAADLSIFPILSLDRGRVHWEDYLWEQTPVQPSVHGGLYKRDDWFAPLGYGGVNGTKVRQLIYLLAQAAGAGARGILTGASVLSPQISSTTVVAAHFGLPCTVVMGGTTPQSALRHTSPAIAARVGATFRFIGVGYNPALQAEVKRLMGLPQFAGYYQLCYGITTPGNASDEEIENFHALGAAQVQSVPSEVHTLHMTAGSCNSCVSVLYGIARYQPAGLRKIVLYQIGPARKQWMAARLDAIQRVSGLPVRRYVEPMLEWHDLHGSGFATYHDRMPASVDGIVLHPTYEGKVMHYRRFQPFRTGELFWIVGSEPTLAPMSARLPADPGVPVVSSNTVAVPRSAARSILGRRSVRAQR